MSYRPFCLVAQFEQAIRIVRRWEGAGQRSFDPEVADAAATYPAGLMGQVDGVEAKCEDVGAWHGQGSALADDLLVFALSEVEQPGACARPDVRAPFGMQVGHIIKAQGRILGDQEDARRVFLDLGTLEHRAGIDLDEG